MSEHWAAADCETTGISPAEGHLLLEIHLEIVEPVYPFRRIAGPFHRVVQQNSQQAFDLADDYVREMHTRTGLWWKIDSGTPAWQVDDDLLGFLQGWTSRGEVFLVGNSLRLDQNFIQAFLPRSAAWMHYRAIDVTSLAMWARHNLGIPRFEKDADHTAGGDTLAMLDELRFITEQACAPADQRAGTMIEPSALDEPSNCCGAGEVVCSPTCSAPFWTDVEREADEPKGTDDGR